MLESNFQHDGFGNRKQKRFCNYSAEKVCELLGSGTGDQGSELKNNYTDKGRSKIFAIFWNIRLIITNCSFKSLIPEPWPPAFLSWVVTFISICNWLILFLSFFLFSFLWISWWSHSPVAKELQQVIWNVNRLIPYLSMFYGKYFFKGLKTGILQPLSTNKTGQIKRENSRCKDCNYYN